MHSVSSSCLHWHAAPTESCIKTLSSVTLSRPRPVAAIESIDPFTLRCVKVAAGPIATRAVRWSASCCCPTHAALPTAWVRAHATPRRPCVLAPGATAEPAALRTGSTRPRMPPLPVAPPRSSPRRGPPGLCRHPRRGVWQCTTPMGIAPPVCGASASPTGRRSRTLSSPRRVPSPIRRFSLPLDQPRLRHWTSLPLDQPPAFHWTSDGAATGPRPCR